MNSLITKIKEDYLAWIILWMGAVCFFAFNWAPGGMDMDSCHYAVVAKGIMQSGGWLKIYDPIDKALFYGHFPLCIWVTTILFKLFGVSVFVAKVFSALSGLLLIVVIFYLGKLLKNEWVGFFGGISFLMTDQIIRVARKCRLDMPLTLFISLAILFFFLAQRRSRWYYLLFGLFTSLAILTKDIAGIAPLAIVFLYLIIRLRWKELFHPLFILGICASLAPVLLWIWLDQGALFNTWFNSNFLYLMKDTKRYVRGYFYLEILATRYFYLLPFALYGGYLAIKRRLSEFYLLIIWAIFFPLVFSFGRQKIDYLIIPMFPAASLLIGLSFDSFLKDVVKQKIASVFKYILLFGTIIALCLPMPMKNKRFDAAVKIAPFVDELVKQAPGYEFILYKQDQASLLFYSQELKTVSPFTDKIALENALTKEDARVRFCYISERDFLGLNPSVRERLKVLFKHKDKVILVNQKDLGIVVKLP